MQESNIQRGNIETTDFLDQVILPNSTKRRILLLLTGVVMLGVYLLETAPSGITSENQLLGISIFFSTTIPAWVYFFQAIKGKESPIPFLPLLAAFYAAYFGLPIFSNQIRWLAPAFHLNTVFRETLLGVLMGWTMLLLGFYIFSRPIHALVPSLYYEIRYDRAPTFGWLLVIAGLVGKVAIEVVRIPTLFRSAVDFVSSFLLAGIVLLLILHLRRQLSVGRSALLLFVVIPAYLFMELGTGLTSGFGMSIVFFGIIYWTQTKKIPVTAVILGLLLMIMIRGGGSGQFRRDVWFGSKDLGPIERGIYHIQLAYQNWIAAPGETFHESLVGVSNRIGYLNTFTYVVDLTPELVPHWEGGSYYALPSSFIPRVIWPSKPTKNLGQQFGHRYGLLDPWDSSTSYNLPYMVEFFVNFGWTGVIIGMFLMGVLYRILYSLLNPPNAPTGTLLIGGVMLFSLLVIEADLSILFGNVITRLLLYLVVLNPILVKVSSPQQS